MGNRWGIAAAVVMACGAALAGCSESSPERAPPPRLASLPADQRTLEARPGAARTIQESDICRLSSGTLFVQNPTRGLAVVDVSDPDRPTIVRQVTSLTGVAGELFVRGADLLVVFQEGAATPGRAEVVGVTDAATAPAPSAPLPLDGRLVASRLVGDLLYLVTREPVGAGARTWITAVDASVPAALRVLDTLAVDGDTHEVHVTDRAVYLAQNLHGDLFHGTRLRHVDISDPSGRLALRGQLDLVGWPQGRFHMDESGTTLRIVTFAGREDGTRLTVVDVSDPDRLRVLGSLALAPGEDLRATRFVGDRAYIVTFMPVVITRQVSGGMLPGAALLAGTFFFIIDPLWIVDLSDPANPTVLGELEIPGWSDYVFPRGDQLLAVGRGGRIGETVAVSLFDVRDPRRPRELRRVEFGAPGLATSEANLDFRGVTVVEPGPLGGEALVVVPFTDNRHDAQGNCAPEHHVQLIDLLADDLTLRGTFRQVGLVRRTFPLGTKLYSISDKTAAVLDVSDRDLPAPTASLELGDVAAVESCAEVFVPRPTIAVAAGGCALAAAGAGRGALGPALALLLLLLLVRRRGGRAYDPRP